MKMTGRHRRPTTSPQRQQFESHLGLKTEGYLGPSRARFDARNEKAPQSSSPKGELGDVTSPRPPPENPVPNPPHLRRETWLRDLAGATFVKAVSLPVAALVGILAIRSLTQTYGISGLALYGLVLSIPLLLPFVDLGLGGAAAEIVASRTAESADMIRTAVNRIYVRLTAITVFVLGIAWSGYSVNLWPKTLGLDIQGANLACAICLSLLAINIPLGIGYRVLLGFQRNQTVVLLQSCGGIVGGIAVLGISQIGLPIWAATAAPQSAAGIAALGATLLARRNLSKFYSVYSATEEHKRGHVQGLYGLAMANLIIGVSLPVAFQSGRIALAHTSTVEQVAIFTAAAQLYMPLASLVQAAGQSLWPRFSGLRGGGKTAPLRKIVATCCYFGACGLLAGVAMVVFGPPVAEWATNGDARPSVKVFVCFAGLLVALAVNIPVGMALMGGRGIRLQALLILVMAIITLLATVAFADHGAFVPPLVTALTLTLIVTIPALIWIRSASEKGGANSAEIATR
ncbi:O-antigen/teichoic acid export membrane protein [Williamsia muralis]|nr:O-antigen/teichoic acid export membrane protein [Williamsia marianensis]